MARPLRIEFPGAIYHAMSRGNARQTIFRDDRDYQRMIEGLEMTVEKFCFEIFSFVFMPNHVHLFFRTMEANLSRGMQYLLSGYANWFNTRHRRPGHLFQGRFKGELIEDERYFWNVSRYLHLNPVRGQRPLVESPRDWPWSSYPSYCSRRQRLPWLACESVFAAWAGELGGTNVEQAYRQFVEAGIRTPPANPLAVAVDGWLLGSREFVDRIKGMARPPKHRDEVPAARRLEMIPLEEVLALTAAYYEVGVESFMQKRGGNPSRDIAAWLGRRLTAATLREMAEPLGLSHPDSVRALVNRAQLAIEASPELGRDIKTLKAKIQQRS